MEVFKTRCRVKRDGKTAHQNADVIIMDGVPHLVAEWKITPEGETPAVTVALDPEVFPSARPELGRGNSPESRHKGQANLIAIVSDPRDRGD